MMLKVVYIKLAIPITISDDRDENVSIIEEAAAIKFVLRENVLKQEGKGEEAEEVVISIMVELMNALDRELAEYLARLGSFVIQYPLYKSSLNRTSILTIILY